MSDRCNTRHRTQPQTRQTPRAVTNGHGVGQNLVSEYTHEDAVVDKVNVGYDIYRIKTELTEQGNKIDAGTAVEIRDRLTKQKRLEVLDQEEEWLAKQLDRIVLAPNQIRTIIQAYKDRCLKECFPERNWNEDKMEWVPKTLIFAKDDDHCDRVVDAVREAVRAMDGAQQSIPHRSANSHRCRAEPILQQGHCHSVTIAAQSTSNLLTFSEMSPNDKQPHHTAKR